ncbi:hypothetical protein HI914_06725 [Erysiphe necator]|nr:hypothetical protein HI914_06725 [Erysiphe necator]
MSGSWQSALRDLCAEKGLGRPIYDTQYKDSIFLCILEVDDETFTGLSTVSSHRANEEAACKAYNYVKKTY